MAKLKLIRRPRGKLYLYPRGKLYLYQFFPNPEGQQCARDRNAEAVKQGALLLKEMEEANNWARLGAQLYFGWFALLLTANALATGWLFARNSPMPAFTPLVFGVFVVLNLMGTIVTYRIRTNLLDSDRRIKEVIETVSQHHLAEYPWSEPQSPVPLQAIDTAFGFTATALAMLVLFWLALVIWWVLDGLR